MNSLYDIKNKFVELATREDLTEEETNELGTLLAQELVNKSTNIIGFIRNTEVNLDALDAEIKRLQDIKKSVTNKLDKFKEYVATNMIDLELPEVVTAIGRITLRKCPSSVEVVNEELIPEEYLKFKIEKKIDKTAILDTYKQNGELVAGTKIVTDKVKLNIR